MGRPDAPLSLNSFPLSQEPSLLAAAEMATRWLHRVVDKSFTHLELRLRVQRVGCDPSTLAWVEAARKAAADGSLQAQIKAQPSVQELAAAGVNLNEGEP